MHPGGSAVNCCCLCPAAHQAACQASRAAAAGFRNRGLSCKHITNWVTLKSTPLAAWQQARCQVRGRRGRHQQRGQGRHCGPMCLLLRVDVLCCALLWLLEWLCGCSSSAGRCLQLAAACACPISKCGLHTACSATGRVSSEGDVRERRGELQPCTVKQLDWQLHARPEGSCSRSCTLRAYCSFALATAQVAAFFHCCLLAAVCLQKLPSQVHRVLSSGLNRAVAFTHLGTLLCPPAA
jgi:hypothetical protein